MQYEHLLLTERIVLKPNQTKRPQRLSHCLQAYVIVLLVVDFPCWEIENPTLHTRKKKRNDQKLKNRNCTKQTLNWSLENFFAQSNTKHIQTHKIWFISTFDHCAHSSTDDQLIHYNFSTLCEFSELTEFHAFGYCCYCRHFTQ